MDISIINRDTVADILHRFTIDCADLALHALRKNLSAGEEKNMPQRLMEGKENSPLRCPIPNQKDQFLMYYPARSAPYPFQLDGLAKECYILFGQIHEKVSGRTFVEKDHFLIPPDQVYKPYTTNSHALALIIIRSPDFQIPCELTHKQSPSSKNPKDSGFRPISALPESPPSDTEAPTTRMASR